LLNYSDKSVARLVSAKDRIAQVYRTKETESYSPHISISEDKEKTVTKTVLITGATSGFGAAMARRFARARWRVVATGRRAERLRTLVAEFGSETVAAAPFDMRDLAAINTTLSALPESFRGIDVLINNAGLALGTAPAPETRLGCE
jgi:NADP-dependent 3-hydroxy acid dehydrogenase YdfG